MWEGDLRYGTSTVSSVVAGRLHHIASTDIVLPHSVWVASISQESALVEGVGTLI